MFKNKVVARVDDKRIFKREEIRDADDHGNTEE